MNPKIGVSISPKKSLFGPLLFTGDLSYGIGRAAALGYDGVELSLKDPEEIDAVQLKAELKQKGISVLAIATGRSWVEDGLSLFTANETKCAAVVKRLKRHIDLAAELGARVILGGVRGKHDPAVEDTAAAMITGKAGIAECAAYAAPKGVTLLLEAINRYEVNTVRSIKEGVDMIREIGAENVRVLADAYHMNIEEPSMAGSIRQYAEYIGYFHIADSNRLVPGRGHIDFKSILKAMDDIDYQGIMGVELLPQPDGETAAAQSIVEIKRLLEAVAAGKAH